MRWLIFLFVMMLSGVLPACRSPIGLPWGVHARTLLSLRNEEIPYKIRSAHFKGSPAEIGKQKGRFLQANPGYKQVYQDMRRFKGLKSAPRNVSEDLLGRFFPHILEEIDGIASASSLQKEELLAIATARLQIGGCSVYVAGDSPVLARNYDWAPTFSENTVVSYNYRSSSLKDSTGMSESIIGRLSGINTSGLAVAIAAINSTKEFSVKYGLSMPVLVRGILDLASTTEEAVRILQKVPHAAPYNYAIVDKNGDYVVVEATPDRVVVRRDDASSGFLSAVNHFVVQSNKENKVWVFSNSKRREVFLSRIRSQKIDRDRERLFRYFGDAEEGPGMANYSMLFGTLWTVVYEPKKGLMHLRAGLNGERAVLSAGEPATAELKALLQDRPGKL